MFQSFGAAAIKALSPRVARVLIAGGFKRSPSFDKTIIGARLERNKGKRKGNNLTRLSFTISRKILILVTKLKLLIVKSVSQF